MSEVDLAQRVARLTAGQRECLDLVDDHATSKEIARQLGISRHTVDARLRGAIQTLGVSSRREAAVIYRTAAQAEAYQSFTYQSPRIVSPLPDRDMAVEVNASGEEDTGDEGEWDREREHGEREHRVPLGIAAASFAAATPPVAHVADSAAWSSAAYPLVRSRTSHPRLWGGANDLTPMQRMLGILVVMILAMLAFGILLSGIEALTLLRT
jgi:DNA-binding CsgD family transcriptional regulator